MQLLLTFVGGYLLIAAYLFFGQNSQVYHPPTGHTATPAQWGMEYETVHLSSGEHTLTNWWIPASDQAEKTILFFHGNATNISEMVDFVDLFRSLDLNVFLLDYRGYGKSEGRPTEAGTDADADAAWRYLVSDKGIAPEEIVVYGHSLGGGVAAGLASQRQIGGLILDGTFTSVPDVGAEIYPYLPVKLMARIFYPTKERIAKLHLPILIIHSKDDEVIPFSHGEKLFAAANEPKMFHQAQGSHHAGFTSGGLISREVLKEFLAGLETL